MKMGGESIGKQKVSGRHGHGLLMAICCGLPMAAILIAVYAFGWDSSGLFWPLLALCLLMHYFMMNGGHRHKSGKQAGGCH
ncbi:MAG: hypothetical protein HY519_02755 [Candidatus Aenigmarchaeota archaeon]|nr:hypothetical protein [Candidatus Aenigmarchaeota archaeon]